MIRRGKHQTDYCVIPNALANDERLTFEHRGLLLYLLSKPENWTVQISDLRQQGGIGKNKAYALLADLEKLGYITREQVNESGRFGETSYVVHDDPQPCPEFRETVDEPLPENRVPENRVPETGTIQSKDSTKDRKIKNTEDGGVIEAALSEYQLIAEQVGLTKVVKLSDKRKAHLKARLVDHGLEIWRAAMRSIPDSRFLSGSNDRGWRPDFDWFVNPTNFLKLIEGKYHGGRSIVGQPALPLGESEEERTHRRHLESWTKGVWIPSWGPRPGEPGCQVPQHLLSHQPENRP